MPERPRRSLCPISSTLDLLGDKWTLLIVRDLMFFGKRTYGELLQSRENIATNILADRLALLEKAEILEKKPFPGNKVKSLYRLTAKGIDLMPVLFEIILWGSAHFEVPGPMRKIAAAIRKDRAGTLKTMTDRLIKGDSQVPAGTHAGKKPRRPLPFRLDDLT